MKCTHANTNQISNDAWQCANCGKVTSRTEPDYFPKGSDMTTTTKHTLTRSGNPPLVFEGELIAESSGSPTNLNSSFRWHDIEVWRTKGGKFIVWVNYVTRWKGEVGHSFTATCDTPAEVTATLKTHDPCEKVGGWPPLPNYFSRQERLLQDIDRAWQAQVSEVLASAEFSEVVE